MQAEISQIIATVEECFNTRDLKKLTSLHCFPLPFYAEHQGEWLLFNEPAEFSNMMAQVFGTFDAYEEPRTHMKVLEFHQEKRGTLSATVSCIHYCQKTMRGTETRTRHFFERNGAGVLISMIEMTMLDRSVFLRKSETDGALNVEDAIAPPKDETSLEFMKSHMEDGTTLKETALEKS